LKYLYRASKVSNDVNIFSWYQFWFWFDKILNLFWQWYFLCSFFYLLFQYFCRGRRGCDRMVVGFTTICAISAYHVTLYHKLWKQSLYVHASIFWVVIISRLGIPETKLSYFATLHDYISKTIDGLVYGYNAAFNNISVISWWSVLLVEKTTVHRNSLTNFIT
jgi:hypothetical protein